MKQPFIEHVQELRRRLLVTVGILFAGAILGYSFRDRILSWLQAPLHTSLYYNDVMGAFNYLMVVCFFTGLLLAVPVLVYNLLQFVRPALPGSVSRGQIMRTVGLSYFLTLGGAAFAYYVSLPIVLHFLTSVNVGHLQPLIAAGSYLNFVVAYLSVFAVVFQLPLILLFIDRITPIPPAALRRARRWVIIGAFATAIILPIVPDPVSQITLALPVIILYEFSLWLIVLAHRRHRLRQELPVLTPSVPTPSAPLRRVELHPISAAARTPRAGHPVPRHLSRPVTDQSVGVRSQVIDLRQKPSSS